MSICLYVYIHIYIYIYIYIKGFGSGRFLSLKGWNSQVHREFPRHFGSAMFSLRILELRTDRSISCHKFKLQKFKVRGRDPRITASSHLSLFLAVMLIVAA